MIHSNGVLISASRAGYGYGSIGYEITSSSDYKLCSICLYRHGTRLPPVLFYLVEQDQDGRIPYVTNFGNRGDKRENLGVPNLTGCHRNDADCAVSSADGICATSRLIWRQK